MTWRRFFAGLGVMAVGAYNVTAALCTYPDGRGLILTALFGYCGWRGGIGIWRGDV